MPTIYGTPYNDNGTNNGGAYRPPLFGTSVQDWIFGLDGNDILYGYSGPDLLIGGKGNDAIYGSDGNDVLVGEPGADMLDGGPGADAMYGGDGNDTYYVDTWSDKVFEDSGHGIDHVFSSLIITTYKWLPVNVENLTLTGIAISGDGNDLNNVIYGTHSANVLYGHGGNDQLYGLGGDDYFSGENGNDTLIGGDGNDTFDGGAGADMMYGGHGNDTYYVDTWLDKVIEEDGNGTDFVRSWVSIGPGWLSGNVENLILLGGYYGYGNQLNNAIYGNNSANTLYGYGGNDTLYGREGSDMLDGGAGNDMLYGGVGVDAMYGGAGDDDFNFTDLSSATIWDFSFIDDDDIGLNGENGEAFDQGLLWTGGVGSTLHSGWYFEGSNGNGASDLSGIYLDVFDLDTGTLWYNPTSFTPGDSKLFATVDLVGGGGVASLSADDFVLI